MAITSVALFQLQMDDFVESIKEMDADELSLHLIYAKDMLSELTEQLEEISYQIAEREKHG